MYTLGEKSSIPEEAIEGTPVKQNTSVKSVWEDDKRWSRGHKHSIVYRSQCGVGAETQQHKQNNI